MPNRKRRSSAVFERKLKEKRARNNDTTKRAASRVRNAANAKRKPENLASVTSPRYGRYRAAKANAARADYISKLNAQRDALREQAKAAKKGTFSRKALYAEAAQIKRQITRLEKLEDPTKYQLEITKAKQRLNDDSKSPAARKNAIFNFQLNRALDEQGTPLFGDSKTARANALAFLNAYKQDWQGEDPSQRLQLILKASGKRTLQEAYEDFMKSETDVGGEVMTWHTFVARWIGISYDNVDTTSTDWQAHIEQAFAALDSPEQDAISEAWARFKG
jgi:hypothetical protein